MVLAHPHCDAGLANVTVAWHLGADRSEHWVVLLTLRVARANQSDVNKGHQMLVVALVLWLAPRDVWVAWPCKFVGSWSWFNLAKGGETAARIMRGRKQTKIWIGFFEHGIPKENVQCNITMTDVSKDALYYWTGLMLVLGLIQELKHSLCEVK